MKSHKEGLYFEKIGVENSGSILSKKRKKIFCIKVIALIPLIHLFAMAIFK